MTVSLSLANLTWAGYSSSLTAQVNIQAKSWTTVKKNPIWLEENRRTATETGACVSMVLAAVLRHFCMIQMRAVFAYAGQRGDILPRLGHWNQASVPHCCSSVRPHRVWQTVPGLQESHVCLLNWPQTLFKSAFIDSFLLLPLRPLRASLKVIK